jgi:hypothetical protein
MAGEAAEHQPTSWGVALMPSSAAVQQSSHAGAWLAPPCLQPAGVGVCHGLQQQVVVWGLMWAASAAAAACGTRCAFTAAAAVSRRRTAGASASSGLGNVPQGCGDVPGQIAAAGPGPVSWPHCKHHSFTSCCLQPGRASGAVAGTGQCCKRSRGRACAFGMEAGNLLQPIGTLGIRVGV